MKNNSHSNSNYKVRNNEFMNDQDNIQYFKKSFYAKFYKDNRQRINYLIKLQQSDLNKKRGINKSVEKISNQKSVLITPFQNNECIKDRDSYTKSINRECIYQGDQQQFDSPIQLRIKNREKVSNPQTQEKSLDLKQQLEMVTKIKSFNRMQKSNVSLQNEKSQNTNIESRPENLRIKLRNKLAEQPEFNFTFNSNEKQFKQKLSRVLKDSLTKSRNDQVSDQMNSLNKKYGEYCFNSYNMNRNNNYLQDKNQIQLNRNQSYDRNNAYNDYSPPYQNKSSRKRDIKSSPKLPLAFRQNMHSSGNKKYNEKYMNEYRLFQNETKLPNIYMNEYYQNQVTDSVSAQLHF